VLAGGGIWDGTTDTGPPGDPRGEPIESQANTATTAPAVEVPAEAPPEAVEEPIETTVVTEPPKPSCGLIGDLVEMTPGYVDPMDPNQAAGILNIKAGTPFTAKRGEADCPPGSVNGLAGQVNVTVSPGVIIDLCVSAGPEAGQEFNSPRHRIVCIDPAA